MKNWSIHLLRLRKENIAPRRRANARNKSPPIEPTPLIVPTIHSTGRYTILESSTYAMEIAELKARGRVPFSFKENVKARIEQVDLYNCRLDSRCGIAYKENSTLIKIIPDCAWLKNIPADFKDAYMTGFTYDTIQDGIEIDTKRGKWNQVLTKSEVLKRP